MRCRFYRLIRDLHLYIGLFISPFVLVFSISVFFLVHAWVPKLSAETSATRVVSNFSLPANLTGLSGRKLVDAVKPGLEELHLAGDVSFIRHQVNEHKLVVPVTIPGRETT